MVPVEGGLESGPSSWWIGERFHCRVVPVVGGLKRGSTVEGSQ